MKESKEIESLLKSHNRWRNECINLIASENVTSPLANKLFVSDLSHRYAEGKPFKRYYQGHKYIDLIEDFVQKLTKKLFGCKNADLRPLSGTQANLCLLKALANRGDTIISEAIPCGGHVSHTRHGVAGMLGLNVFHFPFDSKEMNIDVDKSIALIKEKKPKLLLFGASLFLFPRPIKEILESLDSSVRVTYDAAHVLGLIAGRQFQQPLKEGVEIVSSSTHKTFPGPQGGILLGNNSDFEEIEKVVFPQVVCNHHMHRLPSLGVTMLEEMEVGEEYAKQTIKNAKALAQSLYGHGFDVVAAEKGFTESHQVVVNVSEFGRGKAVAELLEKANIILNKNMLPQDAVDNKYMINPSGIRLGTQEMTRFGMRESEMKQIAEFIKRVVVKKENPEKVKKDVLAFRKEFQKVHFCFDEKKFDYEY